jgi:hypothetical protein
MEGEVALADRPHDFLIEDDEPLAIGLELDLLLRPGETAMITVEVDVLHVCDGIDWDAADGGGDIIEIDDDSAQMDAIRTRFVTSFSVGGIEVE